MGEFNVNTDMFGKYAVIPTGYSKEKHIYKVVSSFYSNSYCDVPIVYNSKPVPHDIIETRENPYGLEHCLNVIHCGIDETKVIRVALKDCKIVQSKTNADRIRNMSDEELAEAILCPHMKDEYDECRYGWHEPEMSCEQCKLQWLKSEMEVEK